MVEGTITQFMKISPPSGSFRKSITSSVYSEEAIKSIVNNMWIVLLMKIGFRAKKIVGSSIAVGFC